MKKFKSPPHKLIAFFKKSRDSWKKRSERYKARLESIRSKVRSLERSRDTWKEKYQQLAGQLSLEKIAFVSTDLQMDGSPTRTDGLPDIRGDTSKSSRSLKVIKKQLKVNRND